jgi:tetratricopeptide (TPR) repeat protein
MKAQIEATDNSYNEEWQLVALEWVYHSLLLGNLEVFTDEIESSSRYYQHTYARRLIADVEAYRKSVEGVSRVYTYHKGQNFIHHNDFESAIGIFESMAVSYDSEDDEFNALVIYQLGKAYYWLGHLSKAETKLEEALELFKASSNIRMQSHASDFLSRVSEAMGNYRQAIAWRLHALRCIRLLLRNPKDFDTFNRDNADRLFSLGEALRLRGSFKIALNIQLRCLEKRRKLSNDHDVGESYITVAKCLIGLRRCRDAEINLDKATSIFESTHDAYMLGNIRLLRGHRFIMEEKNTQAAIEFEEASRLARESQNMRCLAEAKELLQHVESLSHTAD